MQTRTAILRNVLSGSDTLPSYLSTFRGDCHFRKVSEQQFNLLRDVYLLREDAFFVPTHGRDSIYIHKGRVCLEDFLLGKVAWM